MHKLIKLAKENWEVIVIILFILFLQYMIAK